MHPVIDRPFYLKQLRSWRDNGLVKIVTGPRRCGKSFLLRVFQEELKQSGIGNGQILTYDLSELSQLQFRDALILNDDITKRLPSDKRTYLFIDEIQACTGFEKLLASLLHEENLDIYVTGSDAGMLSGKEMTYLTGRYLRLDMYPLSFAEFRGAAAGDGLSADDDFLRYVRTGSYPELAAHRDVPNFIDTFYELLIDSILFKDVGSQFRLKDPTTLKLLVHLLAGKMGSSVSALSLAQTLESKTGKKEVSDVTVGRWLDALSQSFMFVACRRCDVKDQRVLTGLEKFYLTDPGMRAQLQEESTVLSDELLENIVFLELKRRHRRVYAGSIGESKMDFVCRDGQNACYVQVVSSVLDDKVLERKIAPFRKLTDRNPCYLLTLDRIGVDRNIEGVQLMNAVDWLLDSNAAF